MTTEGAPLLHVEDDPDDVLFFQRALAKAGFAMAVRVVRDGDEAVDYLAGQGAYADRERHPLPLLIVLDLKLPKRGGLEVLEWLRGQSDIGRLAAVVLSSSREERDMQRARELGAAACFAKPARFTELVDVARAIGDLWVAARRGDSRS